MGAEREPTKPTIDGVTILAGQPMPMTAAGLDQIAVGASTVSRE